MVSRFIEPEMHREMIDGLKAEQFGVEQELNNCTKADEKFAIAINAILSLGNDAYGIFKNSSIPLKRQLIKFLTRTFYIDTGNVEFTLRSPFDIMPKTGESPKWREWLSMIRNDYYSEIIELGRLKVYYSEFVKQIN